MSSAQQVQPAPSAVVYAQQNPTHNVQQATPPTIGQQTSVSYVPQPQQQQQVVYAQPQQQQQQQVVYAPLPQQQAVFAQPQQQQQIIYAPPPQPQVVYTPQQQQVSAAPPIPAVGLQRAATFVDRESLRPQGAFRSVTPVRTLGAAEAGGVHFTSRRLTSPNRMELRRPSPTVNWMMDNVPRFKYEPPPLIPGYFEVERQALTPARERGHARDGENHDHHSSDDHKASALRIAPSDRWGPPVRQQIPHRFNSVPHSDHSDVGIRSDSRYHQHNGPDVVRYDNSVRSHKGAMDAEQRSRHSRQPKYEDIVITPRNDYPSYEHHQPRHEDDRRRRDETAKYSKRRGDHHDDLNSPENETPSRRHRSSRRHNEYDDPHNVPKSRHHDSRDGDERRSRHRANYHDGSDAQSPDSYVVGERPQARELLVEVERVSGGHTSSRRRPNESEEEYRARRRAEREQRRMLAR